METTSVAKRGKIASGFGRGRTTRNGKCYDETPILQSLPNVGSTFTARERNVKSAPGRGFNNDPRCHQYEYEDVAFGKALTVISYTKGIDAPLNPSNFCICEYILSDGSKLIKSLRTIDLSLGIVEVEIIRDDADREKTNRAV